MNLASTERRKYHRISAVFPIKVKETGLEGNSINVSREGLCASFPSTLTSAKSSSYAKLEIFISRIYGNLTIRTKIIWCRRISNNLFIYGMRFESLNKEQVQLIKKILTKPKIKFIQPYGAICTKMHGVNLTIGCEFGCIYCHYNDWVKDEYPAFINQTFDISPVYTKKRIPKVVYLSPYSEPFSSKAKDLAYDLMSFLLPKGTCIWILTKSVIPDNIIKLIKKYPSQVEVGVGITNLDKKRNRIIEPNCPSAEERLANLKKLKKTGCRYGVRMDPLIPLIDDTPDTLHKTIEKFAQLGVKELISSYLIIPASLLWRLKKINLLQKTLALFTEKSPTTAGIALSIPLEMKKEKYSQMHSICKSYGVTFRICGCREQLIKEAEYLTKCR